MLFWITVTRLTAAVIFLDMCYAQRPELTTKERRTSKYPLKVYNMYKDQLQKKKIRAVGEWSEWGDWTPCSRSCGGGITQQTRNCVNRPTDNRFVKKQRKRRQSVKNVNGCVGLYKRIRLCNSQDCASGQDFRNEQCAAFNNRLFRGTRYQWEPFLTAKEECALNCRAVGMNFFATLNKTVIDGTPCLKPMTNTGKEAAKGSKGVCFEGQCKIVNSRGVIGSLDDDQEECSACLKGSCRSISGIYTRPDLPPGYSLVAQIPAGACRILVQQLKPSRNYLALKNSNGSYVINGDWKFSSSRIFQGAGTKFVYVRQDENSLETFTSPGPLANSIDIMIVNYQPNSGVKYGYSLPLGDGPVLAPPSIKRPQTIEPLVLETKRLDPYPNGTLQRDEGRAQLTPSLHRRTRLRRKHFHWKITGLTACSRSCGGGIQTYVKTCVRELSPHNQTPVHDRRCSHLDSPSPAPIRCNVDPCAPSWEFRWSECSVTCGEGAQRYVPRCAQLTASGEVPMEEAACPGPRPAAQSRACTAVQCETDNELEPDGDVADRWTVGSWSQCSVTCGTGHRTRPVTCPSGRCDVEGRPAHAEYCDAGPGCEATQLAAPTSLSHTIAATSWLTTEWSQCSETCGTGRQTRQAACGDKGAGCPTEGRPELARACSSDKECGGQWFAGPWGSCSDPCTGPSIQRRDVVCVAKIRGQSHVTNEMTCAGQPRPPAERACSDEGGCPPSWYSGEWGQCEGGCPVGVQRRRVACLGREGRAADGCPDDDMPVAKRTCACEGGQGQQQQQQGGSRERYQPAHDEPVDRSCVDRIRKCKVAVQARLCNYPYYTTHCCESCRRAQDFLE